MSTFTLMHTHALTHTHIHTMYLYTLMIKWKWHHMWMYALLCGWCAHVKPHLGSDCLAGNVNKCMHTCMHEYTTAKFPLHGLLFNLDIKVIAVALWHFICLHLYHILVSKMEWFQKNSKLLNLNHSKVSPQAYFVNTHASELVAMKLPKHLPMATYNTAL